MISGQSLMVFQKGDVKLSKVHRLFGGARLADGGDDLGRSCWRVTLAWNQSELTQQDCRMPHATIAEGQRHWALIICLIIWGSDVNPSKVTHSTMPPGCGGVVGLRKTQGREWGKNRVSDILWCLFSARGDVGPKQSYLISSGSSRSYVPQRSGLVEELSS